MQWIKAHLVIVICGAVSVIALGMLVWAFMDTSVADAMQRDVGLQSTLRSPPHVNEKIITAERDREQRNQKQLAKIQSNLATMGTHKPLRTDVFPEPANQSAPFEFKNDYRKQFDELLKVLKAEDEPDAADYAEEAAAMESRRRQEEFEARVGLDAAASGKGRAPRDRGDRPRAGGPPPPGPAGMGGRGDDYFAQLSPEERIKEDPRVRVSVRRARQIECYANLDAFDQRASVISSSRPGIEDMWYAQMSLWIQQDVVNALAALNARIAESKPEPDRWVGNLPVKRLFSIRIGNYQPPGGGKGTATFTKRQANDTVDVISFRMDVVVEAAKLPMLIDEVSRAGFYTLTSLNYQAVPLGDGLTGCIYGSVGVVRAQMEFEGCLLRSKYEALMPPSVAAAIKEGRAVLGSGGSDTGGLMGGGRPGRG